MNNFAKSMLLTQSTHPPTLLLAELSAICELAIHLVSPTTVLACGRRPTSLTVIIRCRDDFRTRTASSCGTLRKLRPLTSKIWSPTCGEGRAHRGMVGGAEQGGKGGPSCRVQRSKVRERGDVTVVQVCGSEQKNWVIGFILKAVTFRLGHEETYLYNVQKNSLQSSRPWLFNLELKRFSNVILHLFKGLAWRQQQWGYNDVHTENYLCMYLRPLAMKQNSSCNLGLRPLSNVNHPHLFCMGLDWSFKAMLGFISQSGTLKVELYPASTCFQSWYTLCIYKVHFCLKIAILLWLANQVSHSNVIWNL